MVDVLQTVINLVLYVATLQIESAIFRFLIDNRDNTEIKRIYLYGAFYCGFYDRNHYADCIVGK